ncbi:N-acetyltransferase [Sporosarcina sp. NCCP-2716]|uniref:GNAT family N-acetyltransferase n=1 Tax=Sporosarcina sp. NCCP-2716 TaxID=2943679 RepID=UPI00203A8629|nr:GNAT family N-acetyltransferase [Sporosarcina sp. NCCP-2716]GKV70452.1 N-acetyltransferase [Sporosarcina sp. NCCP-2716]
MQIRPIEMKENKAIEQIIMESLEAVGLDIPGTAYTDPQLGNLAGFYSQLEGAGYWVAVDADGSVLGGVGIGPFGEESGVCELQKLYVDRDARGRGLSRELMTAALAFAAQHYEQCYLETSTKLVVANELYAKLGFRKLEQPLAGSEHGAMDAWYMKELD